MTPRRLTLFVSLLLAATIAFAGNRTVDSGTRPQSGATVGGVVTSVSGNLIQLADGGIVIDATNADFSTDRGKQGSIADIEAGMIVFASLTTADVNANAPLPAATITATRIPDATLFGPVQSVDTTAKTITLLGRTIKITDATSFGGILKKRDGDSTGLGDILPNHIVSVVVDATGGQLVATSVLLLAPAPPQIEATRGTVKSIGADSWTIEREGGSTITVAIDAQTKIVGSPKVGDSVEVLYRVDNANAFVAISIIKFDRPSLPIPELLRITGKVKTIDSQSWVITNDAGEQKVRIDRNTKIEPGIAVGDSVEILAQKSSDGSVTAVLIVKKR